jgi:hypothetical protein
VATYFGGMIVFTPTLTFDSMLPSRELCEKVYSKVLKRAARVIASKGGAISLITRR